MLKATIKAIALMLVATVAAFPQATDTQAPPDNERSQDRVQNCGKVLGEILGGPHLGLDYALDRADCVIVLPGVIKGNGFIFTFLFGGTFGRGAMTCRSGPNFDGPWGAPTMVALEGVNWGFEGGAASVDILITVMNSDGANSLLTTKAKIGGDVTATAGPVGRVGAAEEDVVLHSELLTYSRAKGLFAGVGLTGSTLRADGPANTKLYGHHVNAKDVVFKGAEAPPDSAKLLLDTLNKQSPKRVTGPNAPQPPAAK
ncbi:MAG: lipid-binding SYLF domain-containing protein [Candidatus Acidiferrales bacterium]